ncbi:MAG: deoxyguanosinetriphosphate triphosphohydrolase [Acidobacteria bacterium]|nr:deoxyguanosinetriphosphate triphosphohydrolase [Acidobacteriota bacterium]
MALAAYAMQESASRGRRHPEPAHAYRSAYARDRDRVIHSRAFRRLESKTQVFTTRYSDHFRNRLTHTLEVAQIARTAAGALGLNTELVEALALVHDIGHPPFGHAGESCLDGLMREHPPGAGFDHNLHALRTVEQFEQRYLDFPGLNLTFEVREGIIKHSREYSAEEFPELAEYSLSLRPPLEAQLIDLVDEIAYNIADLDDGFEARLLDLPVILAEVPLFSEMYKEVDRIYPVARTKLKFNEANKRALDRLVTDLIEHTRTQLAASGVYGVEDVRRYSRRLASFSPEGTRHNIAWKKFLLAHLYESPAINEERDACVAALGELFRFYLEHPEKMPQFYFQQAQSEPRHRVVCDYVAGMTDHFLLRQHRELIGGKTE